MDYPVNKTSKQLKLLECVSYARWCHYRVMCNIEEYNRLWNTDATEEEVFHVKKGLQQHIKELSSERKEYMQRARLIKNDYFL